jgi:hypothetical protein
MGTVLPHFLDSKAHFCHILQFLKLHGVSHDGDTWWHIWLRRCATSSKVTGSIPDGVIGISPWLNSSGCAVPLGSAQPLTEMSTRKISPVVKATGAYGWQPYHLHMPIVWKSGILNLLEPLGCLQACTGIAIFYIWWHIRIDIKNCVVELNCEENGHAPNRNHGAEMQSDARSIAVYICC